MAQQVHDRPMFSESLSKRPALAPEPVSSRGAAAERGRKVPTRSIMKRGIRDKRRNELHADRPIGPNDADYLGFGQVAQRLAGAILYQASSDGLVIGIEGVWGSGKSSLLNLTVASLKKMRRRHKPIVVRFQPWIVGDRDALLTTLLADIAKAIEPIEAEAKGAKK